MISTFSGFFCLKSIEFSLSVVFDFIMRSKFCSFPRINDFVRLSTVPDCLVSEILYAERKLQTIHWPILNFTGISLVKVDPVTGEIYVKGFVGSNEFLISLWILQKKGVKFSVEKSFLLLLLFSTTLCLDSFFSFLRET